MACNTIQLIIIHYTVERIRTLVEKYSDGESLLALYEETWMKRSISYLAVASAMRSVPSTWTSA